jgi:hypothetical protein
LEDLEKQQMFLEDQRRAILKGIEEGLQQGLQQGQVELILRQLDRRLGTISPENQSRIRQLSLEQLENLADAVLDFTSAAELTAWLQAQTHV